MANQDPSQKQAQGGQDHMGRKPNDPSYDQTTDPASPQYDASKAGKQQGGAQTR